MSVMDRVQVVRFIPDAWRDCRAICLAALADAPSAFGSTLAAEQRLGAAAWRARLAGRARFVVLARGEAVGTTGGITDAGAESGAILVSMWVHPTWRGRGAGDLLVRTMLVWARGEGHRQVRPWVSTGNGPAEHPYARHGFVRTGESQPITTDDPARWEFAMARTIDAAAVSESRWAAPDRV